MQKLILFDVDSTLINQEVIELIAAKAGVESEVAKITSEAMAGKLDFETSLKARVALLTGLPESVLVDVQSEITLTNGAADLIKEIHSRGHIPAVVSGGFTAVIAPLMQELRINEYAANSLEISDGKLTGEVIGDVIDRSAKAAKLKVLAGKYGIEMANTIAVGDGANDIDMVKAAGLGIAFCAKEALNTVAHIQISKRDLREVIQYL